MDPNAALIQLLEAIELRDRWLAEMTLDAIMHWLDKGGFAPPGLIPAIELLKQKERT